MGRPKVISMTLHRHEPVISLMLAVLDAPAAVEWYKQALDASVLWSLGSVAGLQIEGAPFFVAEPSKNEWDSHHQLGPLPSG